MLIILGVIFWALNKYALEPVGRWWQRDGLNKVIAKYENTLVWSLNHRLSVLGISAVVLVLSFVVLGAFNPGTEFFLKTSLHVMCMYR